MPALHIVTDLTDQLLSFIKDDPVRPEIAVEQRVSESSKVFVLLGDHQEPLAITCVRFMTSVPSTVQDLWLETDAPTHAVFYTIWSYQAGAGRKLIQAAQAYIKQAYPLVTTYITLSPKTELARRFHLKNGASVHRENELTVNYLYS
jgi:hypothetical protein